MAGNDISIRAARPEDVGLILSLIRELAEYEKMLDQVVCSEELLDRWIFQENKAEVLIAESAGEGVGFALFFSSFSTFLGLPGIYLEDLYVRPQMRGKGIGKALLAALARLVVERGYGRLEWSCLDWNKPSIDFYLSLGATAQDDWTTYRLVGEPLLKLAKRIS